MGKTALFVRHRARPGQRDEVRRIWERYVKPRAETNPAHEAYYFCFDDIDQDVICVFQLYSGVTAAHDFMSGDWYAEYLLVVSRVLVAPPEIVPASLVWSKSVEPRPL